MEKRQKVSICIAIAMTVALVIATIPSYLSNIERDKRIAHSVSVSSSMVDRLKDRDSKKYKENFNFGSAYYCSLVYSKLNEKQKVGKSLQLVPENKEVLKSDGAKDAIILLKNMPPVDAYNNCEQLVTNM
ncbi:hypothetical protein [Vibrio natriegens]|uniref:hypothetical protein n=1 Tax=Vibrio natriegens TaxID=691 RepID=UPI001FB96BC1|nr:hypothetical protein [Vibrio natriegens]